MKNSHLKIVVALSAAVSLVGLAPDFGWGQRPSRAAQQRPAQNNNARSNNGRPDNQEKRDENKQEASEERGRGRDRDDGNRDDRRRDDRRRDDRRRGRNDRNRDEDQNRERRRTPEENPDLEVQLKALDVDKNGKLDPLEANRVSLAVFKRLGLDSTQSISLAALDSVLVQTNLDDLSLAELGEFSEVPEFDDAPRFQNFPDAFEVTENEKLLDKRPLEERYSQFVIDQTRSMLASFDKNNDRMLDIQEQSVIPWGNPEPAKSDLDDNGLLSEIELCERLAKRTKDGFVPANAEKEDSPSRGRSRDDQRSRTARAEPVKKARPKLSQNAQVSKYVKDLIQKYDKNSNGSLEEDEVKEMRSPPKPGVDTDKNKVFTFEELYVHYSGGEKKAKKSRSRSVSDLPGTVFWDPLLKESKGSSSKRGSSNSDRSDRGSKVPTIRFGIK